MSHACGKTSSTKDKTSNLFYKRIKPPISDRSTTNKAFADFKCVKRSKSDGHHRMKRLHTRRVRNQMRDGGKGAIKVKSTQLYCSHIKDFSHIHQCCHNTSNTGTLPNFVPITHEPSVITDGRLLGHHGLFNHEVKSIDIERLLSEQRKLDRNVKMAENSNSSFSNSVFAADPPSNERPCLLESGEKTRKFLKKHLPATNTFNDLQAQDDKTMELNSHCSDLTPGQKPRKSCNSPTETNKNDNSSKHSSSDAGVSGIGEVQPAFFENNSESQTPCSFNKNSTNVLKQSVPSFIECSPKKSALASNQTQASHPSPQLPSIPTMAAASTILDTKEDSLVSDSVAKSVNAIAARLCDGVSFSLLRKRNLVADSRRTLLKALRQRHGPQLQRKIVKIQQLLYSYVAEEEQGDVLKLGYIPKFTDEGPFSTDGFKARSFAISTFGETEEAPFERNSTDFSNPFDPTADWLGIPAETPIVLDDTFSRRCSPLFPIDFEFKTSFERERGHLFPLFSSSSFVDGLRSSGHVEEFFTSAKGKEFAMPDLTQNYINCYDMRTLENRRSPRTSVVNDHHYSFDPHHSKSVPFPQVHSLFEMHKYSDGKSSFEEIPHFHQESSFEPLSHLSLPSASPALRNPPVDIAHYPPSYMLERDSSLSLDSRFPSPENWSFPPMRLY